MVWHYVQELQAAEIAGQLSGDTAERVRQLRELLPVLIEGRVQLQEA